MNKSNSPLQFNSTNNAVSTSLAQFYDQDLVTFEEGKVAYDHRDAAGFIKLNALRLRTLAQRHKKLGK